MNEQRGSESLQLGFGGIVARPGDHIGHFYQNEEERWELLLPFLRTGLERGDECVYFSASPESDEALRSRLADSSGVDLADALESGRLVLHPGFSTPEEMSAFLRAALERARTHAAMLWWGGEMTWVFRKLEDSRALMRWESACNEVEERTRAVFFCQYSLPEFPGAVVIDALRTHPVCIVGRSVQHNPFYMEPEEFLADLEARPAFAFSRA